MWWEYVLAARFEEEDDDDEGEVVEEDARVRVSHSYKGASVKEITLTILQQVVDASAHFYDAFVVSSSDDSWHAKGNSVNG